MPTLSSICTTLQVVVLFNYKSKAMDLQVTRCPSKLPTFTMLHEGEIEVFAVR